MSKSTAASEQATPTSAILLVFCAGFLFSCLDSSAKYLVLSGLPATFISWVRFAVHVVLVLLLFRSWANPAMFRVKSLPMQVLRGVFLFGSTIFNFAALRTLQLAETTSIYFFAPMVITALAGPLLGEWAGWRRWMAILAGFVGVLVITRPGVAAFQLGHIYAICSTISYCLYVIMTRHMGATETAESLIFYSALAPYPYLQMVWMIGFGYLVFDQLPDGWTLGGAGIIVASGFYIVHRERQLRLGRRTVPMAEDEDLAKRL